MYESEIFPISRHARRCMHYIYYWGEQNHITFLGDSRIRQLYFEFVNLLSLKRVDELKAHQNLHFEDKKISVTAVCNLLGFFLFFHTCKLFYSVLNLPRHVFLIQELKKGKSSSLTIGLKGMKIKQE